MQTTLNTSRPPALPPASATLHSPNADGDDELFLPSLPKQQQQPTMRHQQPQRKMSANPFRSLVKKWRSRDVLTGNAQHETDCDSDSDMDFECCGGVDECMPRTNTADADEGVLLISTSVGVRSTHSHGGAHAASLSCDSDDMPASACPSLSNSEASCGSSLLSSPSMSARSSASLSSATSMASSFASIASLPSSSSFVALSAVQREQANLRTSSSVAVPKHAIDISHARQADREEQAAIDALEAYFAQHIKPRANSVSHGLHTRSSNDRSMSTTSTVPHSYFHPELKVDEYGRRASEPMSSTHSKTLPSGFQGLDPLARRQAPTKPTTQVTERAAGPVQRERSLPIVPTHEATAPNDQTAGRHLRSMRSEASLRSGNLSVSSPILTNGLSLGKRRPSLGPLFSGEQSLTPRTMLRAGPPAGVVLQTEREWSTPAHSMRRARSSTHSSVAPGLSLVTEDVPAVPAIPPTAFAQTSVPNDDRSLIRDVLARRPPLQRYHSSSRT